MFNSKLTKKKSYASILVIFLLMIIAITFFIHINNQKTIYTSTTIISDTAKDKGFDYDGDGIIDDISLIATNSTYSLRIKNSLGESLFISSTNDFSLLDITPTCYPTLHYVDLTRDKIPELIVSGLKNSNPVFYVFQWQNNNFNEIYFSQKNILGILDFNNSRTPRLLSSDSSKGNESTTGMIINNFSTKDITFSKPIIPSFNTLQILIDIIEVDYDLDEAPDLFSPYIDSNQLGLLWNLDKSKYRYSFQKAYFYDTSWDDSTKVTSIYWCLSFEKTNILDSKEGPKELILYVTADLNENGDYKISSMIKN